MALTDTAIRAAKAVGKPRKISDGGAFSSMFCRPDRSSGGLPAASTASKRRSLLVFKVRRRFKKCARSEIIAPTCLRPCPPNPVTHQLNLMPPSRH